MKNYSKILISNKLQPPIPVKAWENIFDASKEGPSCPQSKSRLMSEDCLRLNIYTKEACIILGDYVF